MKKIVFFAAMLLMTACGVSQKDKEYMQIVLQNSLNEYYMNSDVSCMFLKADLKKVEKSELPDSKYIGHFSTEFESHNKPVRLYGDVYFDESFQIKKMSSEYGKNIVGIYIFLGYISNKEIDTQTDSVVLPIFINHSNYFKNNNER